MPTEDREQLPIYICPHCDETFACTEPGDQIEISLHRVLHLSKLPERVDNVSGGSTIRHERPERGVDFREGGGHH